MTHIIFYIVPNILISALRSESRGLILGNDMSSHGITVILYIITG